MVTVVPQVVYSQHLSPGLVCLSLDDFQHLVPSLSDTPVPSLSGSTWWMNCGCASLGPVSELTGLFSCLSMERRGG